MIIDFIDYLQERLGSVKIICYFLLAAIVIIDFFVDKHHAHTSAEHIPGFWAVFGFGACVLLIFLAKWVAHQGISTKEDYYD